MNLMTNFKSINFISYVAQNMLVNAYLKLIIDNEREHTQRH